jgi:hypothetical protein
MRLSLCLLSWHSHNFWPVGQHPQHISTHDVNASWVPKLKWPQRTYLTFNASLHIHIRYCVIFVSLCLFSCTKNFGQCARNKFMHKESFSFETIFISRHCQQNIHWDQTPAGSSFTIKIMIMITPLIMLRSLRSLLFKLK